MDIQSRSLSISKATLNQVFEAKGYYHLDITARDVRGLTMTPLLRFKMFNSSGKVGFEFRQRADWPQIFDKWPGEARDQWGGVYSIFAGEERSLTRLDVRGRQTLADLIGAIVNIIEMSASDTKNYAIYLSDAQAIFKQSKPFVDRESAMTSLPGKSVPANTMPSAPDRIDIHKRVHSIENLYVELRRELDAYTENLAGPSVDQITSAVEEARTFTEQLPQILNTIYSAHADSRVVKEGARSDSGSSAITKSLNELRREMSAVWEALDTLSKKHGSQALRSG